MLGSRVNRLVGLTPVEVESHREPDEIVRRLDSSAAGAAFVQSRPPNLKIAWIARSETPLGPARHTATQVFIGQVRATPTGALLTGTVGTARAVVWFLLIFVVLASAGAQSLMEEAIGAIRGVPVEADAILVGLTGLIVFSAPLVFYKAVLGPFIRRDRRLLIEMIRRAASADRVAGSRR